MNTCEAEVFDTTAESAYESGSLEFGVSVDNCCHSRVWFTVDIAYPEGSSEKQFSVELSGETSTTYRTSVAGGILGISDPRDIRCNCIE